MSGLVQDAPPPAPAKASLVSANGEAAAAVFKRAMDPKVSRSRRRELTLIHAQHVGIGQALVGAAIDEASRKLPEAVAELGVVTAEAKKSARDIAAHAKIITASAAALGAIAALLVL